MTLTRTHSTLPSHLEELAERVIGMCLRVHTALGPGMNERVYVRACQIELDETGVPYDSERAIPIRYREKLICTAAN